MGIEVMSLLPQFAPAPASADHSSPTPASSDNSGSQGSGFEGLLASISGAPKATNQPAPTDPVAKPDAMATPAKEQLRQVLSSLAGAKVDLNAPGLGLTAAQQQQLLAKLQKLLQDGAEDGAEDGAQLLASLLAASQLAARQPAELATLAKLLGTTAQGTVSADALSSNLHLLVQAIQLMADSGDKMTLLQAVQQLTPPGDAFTQKLAAVLAQADAQRPALSTQHSAETDTGPPKGESPGEADSQASATAGSNGHESTVTPTGATSPADGAAQEAGNPPEASDIKALAQALEDLLQGHQPRQVQLAPAAKQATTEASTGRTGAAAAADQPAPAVQLAHMAPEKILAARKPQVAVSQPGGPAGSGEKPAQAANAGNGTALDETSQAELPAAVPLPGARGQSTGDGDGQQQQQGNTAAGGQTQSPTVVVAQAAPTTFEAALDLTQVAASEAPVKPALEQSILDQVVQNASLALRNGEQELRIQLKPDFLGVMEVRVSMDSGTVSVRMSVESAATRQLIDNNIGQLRQAFGTDQIRVEHVPGFASSDAPMSFGQGNQHGFWQGQNPHAGLGQLPEAIPYNGNGETESSEDAALSTQHAALSTSEEHSALVDLHA